MRRCCRLILQLLLMFLPVSLSARVITSEVYNGITYTKGYVCDFQVDGLYYTIQENGVYVSAERHLYASKPLREPNEVVVNSLYSYPYRKDVAIPDTVMYEGTVYNVIGIDAYAFIGCKNLIKVSIPNSVLYIGSYAFYDCSSLKNITLPDSLSVIKESVFELCSSLEYVYWPKNLTAIGFDAFESCKKLTSLYIPNSVKRIYSGAFSGCKGLTVLSVPSSVIQLDDGAFNGCSNINTIYWDTNLSPGKVVNTCSKALKYIRLSDTTEKIENSTFYGCENLLSITIPKKVKYLDAYSFCGCSSLKKIVIEGSPKIYEFVFADCSNIDSIILKSPTPPKAGFRYDLPYSYWLSTSNPFIKKIQDKAVLSIPEGSFGEYAASDIWSHFNSLYSFSTEGYVSDFENNTIYYTVQDDGVFVGAKSLNLDIYVDEFRFDGPLTPRDPATGGLQPRSIIRSLLGGTEIDSAYYTRYRGNILIPESVSANDTVYSVTGIKYFAFIGSKELESVSIPDSVKHLGYGSFAGCSGLKSVNIPLGVTMIPNALFYGCTSLGSVEIPDGVLTIGQCAFYECSSITEIIIPAGVELIDEYAFADCSGLKRVVIKGDPIIAETAFIGCAPEFEIIRTGVETFEVTDPDSNVDGAVHYSIDGRIISADVPGLHIIKYRNGTVRKAVVR